jgi:hypothetical protein
MKLVYIFSFGVLFALTAGASQAWACTCSGSAATVLEEFARVPIVAAVRLEEFEELDRTVEAGNVYRTMAAVLTVESVYKGTLKAGQRIKVLDGGGGDCSTGFLRDKPGQRFLFYTGPAKRIGSLRGSLFLIDRCSRSDRFEAARGDLAYLDNRAKLAGKTRLSGMVKRFSPNPPSLANIKVSVTGKNFERVVETDEAGFFDIWDLPAGQYRVAFGVPSGIRVRDYKIVPSDRSWRRQAPPDNTIQAVVGPRKHVELTIGLDSQVSGKR